ncbi:MAG: pyridoxine 5'-phosphate synthase [Deltaproteobacteria bacterium]|nr:pyridoxine 5'-phosphate synthase [Deltaproteobacteria bacterium]
MPIRLHVNIDHVATLRQARGTQYPDPVFAAQLCEQAGADGITLHLREDRRHIVDRDVERMRDAITTLMNLECAATDEMVDIAVRLRPDVVTLVPERREERTTEGGLDAASHRAHLGPRIARLVDAGIKVSLFVAADEAQVDAAVALGARQVEFHTGPYAHARAPVGRDVERTLIAQASRAAKARGLEVAAGHGLTRSNVVGVASIPEIEELNIGHAIIADAVLMGLPRAVRAMRAAIRRGVRVRRAKP